MRLNFIGNIAPLKKGIVLLQGKLGFVLRDDGIAVEVSQREGNIEVSMSSGKAAIKYQEKIHFFRALGLLLEKLRNGETDFTISETPNFKTIGIMIDCSRNAVMTVPTIKNIIEYMAVMGLNMLMLYTEDTYEIESLPYFGYMRGRYTKAELKECDEFADIFGIEMIPCIQTLAHLHAALKWNYMPGIRDTDDILFVGEEATYEFVEKMIAAASAPFKSRRIHIGMDEAHALGTGKYHLKNGYKRRFDIINEHLNRVLDITRKYSLEPMIWSDMYFRISSSTGDYYDKNPAIPQDVIDGIPKGVDLVYWDYYHNIPSEYKRMIELHKRLGSTPIFAGGIWTWSGIIPAYDKTFVSTNAALMACKECGVNEVFATLWGDNGGETNIYYALLGLQLYAEHGYAKGVDNDTLCRRFKTCVGEDMQAFLDIDKLDLKFDDKGHYLTDDISYSQPNPSKYLLWQDILIGLFDKHVQGLHLSEHYVKIVKDLEKTVKNSGDLKEHFEHLSCLAHVLAQKCDMGAELKWAYDNKDIGKIKEFVNVKLPALKELVEKLRQMHQSQWMNTYKPFGWEVIDMRYGGLLARIDTAIFRLTQYIKGNINEIEELGEERLCFDGLRPQNEGFCRCNVYNRIVSAGSLGYNI